MRADLTMSEINATILNPNNGDMLASYNDLSTLAQMDRARQKFNLLFSTAGVGIFGVSAYNMTRMKVLSKTGKVGAVLGLYVGFSL